MFKKTNNDTMDEFNRKSIRILKEKDALVVENNPVFFDEDSMERFGYQSFTVHKNGTKNYLNVDRSVERGNYRVELNTSVYEMDEHSVITKLVGSVRKKVTNIRSSK